MKWKEYLNSTTYIAAFITIWIFFPAVSSFYSSCFGGHVHRPLPQRGN